MNQVILISEKYLKNFSSIDINVDSKNLLSSIYKAQENHLLPLLGTDLYNAICLQASGNTLTTLNSTLLNSYIRPCLAAYSIYELPDNLEFQITNTGIQELRSNNSDTTDESKFNKLKVKLLLDAQSLAEKLSRYLIGNSSNYPLYYTGNNTIDKITPIRPQMGTIYFPRGYYNYNHRCCKRY
jgi:hypothetical protein